MGRPKGAKDKKPRDLERYEKKRRKRARLEIATMEILDLEKVLSARVIAAKTGVQVSDTRRVLADLAHADVACVIQIGTGDNALFALLPPSASEDPGKQLLLAFAL